MPYDRRFPDHREDEVTRTEVRPEDRAGSQTHVDGGLAVAGAADDRLLDPEHVVRRDVTSHEVAEGLDVTGDVHDFGLAPAGEPQADGDGLFRADQRDPAAPQITAPDHPLTVTVVAFGQCLRNGHDRYV